MTTFGDKLRSTETIDAFHRLQGHLLSVWHLIEDANPRAHTSIVVPSLSMNQEELSKVKGVSLYEERLMFSLIRLRHPRARVVYVTSQPIHHDIVDYYLNLLAGVPARHASSRLHMLCVHDATPRPLTEKILERPRLIQRIRELAGDPSSAYLTCFNSSELERLLAVEVGVPLNGVDPALLEHGTKSGCRKVFKKAGVNLPAGFEDLFTRAEVVEALDELWAMRPRLEKAVLKLNEAFAGTGNAILSLPPERPADRVKRHDLLDRVIDNAAWSTADETAPAFLRKLAGMGGIVEEFVTGREVKSPSVQMRINPNGRLEHVSNHDQVLGGPTGQSYLGCRFPADPAYRIVIQEQADKIGQVLCDYGVISRFGIDFMVAKNDDGSWTSWAIEINLRMGGTTHPFMALQLLTGGELDRSSGVFLTPTGVPKTYYSTDNLMSPAYRGLLPDDLVDILTMHKLHFHQGTQTGVIFHMIGALSQYGKIGVTCVGNDRQEADHLYQRTAEVLDRETQAVASTEAPPLHPFDLPLPRME